MLNNLLLFNFFSFFFKNNLIFNKIINFYIVKLLKIINYGIIIIFFEKFFIEYFFKFKFKKNYFINSITLNIFIIQCIIIIILFCF